MGLTLCPPETGAGGEGLSHTRAGPCLGREARELPLLLLLSEDRLPLDR